METVKVRAGKTWKDNNEFSDEGSVYSISKGKIWLFSVDNQKKYWGTPKNRQTDSGTKLPQNCSRPKTGYLEVWKKKKHQNYFRRNFSNQEREILYTGNVNFYKKNEENFAQ